jgi:hypothetical protein
MLSLPALLEPFSPFSYLRGLLRPGSLTAARSENDRTANSDQNLVLSVVCVRLCQVIPLDDSKGIEGVRVRTLVVEQPLVFNQPVLVRLPTCPGLYAGQLGVRVGQEYRGRLEAQLKRVVLITEDLAKEREWVFAGDENGAEQCSPHHGFFVGRARLSAASLAPARTCYIPATMLALVNAQRRFGHDR